MHLLPPTLGVVADHAERQPGTRFAVHVVQLVLTEGRFRATATDTKQLLDVSGPTVAEAERFEMWGELAAHPDDGRQALIPAGAWKAFFADAKRSTKRASEGSPDRAVAVRVGTDTTALAFRGEYRDEMATFAHVEGRFPPADVIWPKNEPKFVIDLDPNLLAQVSKTLATLAGRHAPRMRVELRGKDRPVIFRADGPDGVTARALLMPLTELGDSPPPNGECGEPTADEYTALWAELVAVTAERDRLRVEVDELRKVTPSGGLTPSASQTPCGSEG